MKQLYNKYNKAIALIKEDQLEEAKRILVSILSSAPFHSETNWTAGLVEIMQGNPVVGLKYWERVNTEAFPQIHEIKEKVVSTLGAYEEVRGLYNYALSLVNEKKVAEAEVVISPLFQQESTFPLPQDVYRLYFIILFENGKIEQAFELFSKAPVTIQKASSINRLINGVINEMHNEQTVAEREQENLLVLKKKKTRKTGRFVLTASVLVAVIIGGTYLTSREWKSTPANNEFSSTTQEVATTNTKEFEKQIEELESKLTSMETEKENLKKELESKLAKVSQYETTEELYKKANLDVTSLRSNEARQQFNSGYTLYQQGDFTGAKEKLELSLQLDSTQYFSDDSLYYIIQTLQQLGTLSGDSELFQQFFTSESEHFVDSPYQDDLLVVQADAYYREGKKEEALTILLQVQEQYPSEWTASYAKKLAKVIQEG